ncbi:MAG: group III truncated hemoglobin [Bacteroidota bacterium]
MLKDIENRDDLYLVVSEFYKKLLADQGINYFFEKFNDHKTLEKHLSILVDFWDNVLFYSGTYAKNAMMPHLNLHKKEPFSEDHFKIWLGHFNNSVDENFSGTNAHNLKIRALSIATVMQIKIKELQ